MDEEIAIFLRTSKPIKVVRGAVEDILGHEMEPYDQNPGVGYVTSALGLDLTFYDDPPFVDDCGIEFTKYQFYLGFRAHSYAMEFSEFEPMYSSLVMFMAARLVRVLRCQAIVVGNLVHKLAEFDIALM